jgi:hypothetical protein
LSEPTFSNLKGSIGELALSISRQLIILSTVSGAFYAMKAVLSYYHSSKKNTASLCGMDYLLVVPFIEVASTKISRFICNQSINQSINQ